MKKRHGVLTEVSEKDVKLLYKNPKKFWKGVTSIGEGAFDSLENLEKLHIPGTVKKIVTSAISFNSNLKEVIIDEGIKEIDFEAFDSNYNIEKLKIPGSLEKISEKSFNNLDHVEYMEIGEGIKEIEKMAIRVTDADMIIFPKSLKNINETNIFSKNNVYISRISENDSRYPGCAIISKQPLSDEFKVEVAFNTKDIFAIVDKKNIPSQIISVINDGKINVEYPEDMKKLNEFLLKNKLKLPIQFVERLKNEGKLSDFIENARFKAYRRMQEELEYYMYGETFAFAYNIGCFSSDPQLANAANTWLESLMKIDKNHNSKLNIYDIERMGLSLPLKGENKEFSEFLFGKNDRTGNSNFDELLKELNKEKLLNDIYNEYFLTEDQLDEAKKNRRTRDENGKLKIRAMVDTVNERGEHAKKQKDFKPTVEIFKKYFQESSYQHNGNERNKKLADEFAKFNLTKEEFEEAINIYEQFDMLNIPSNILGVHIKEVIDYNSKTNKLAQEAIEVSKDIINDLENVIEEEFTYEWLEKHDPKNFVLGLYCDCCAHLYGAGHGIMKSNFVHPDIQNLVINDKNGNPIAKSTAYINRKEGYIVFNNVEVSSEFEDSAEQIYIKYKEGIKSFVEKYNLMNPSKPIKKVNVGMGNNDLEEQIRNGGKPSSILQSLKFGEYAQKDRGDYMGDWNSKQYTVYKNKK